MPAPSPSSNICCGAVYRHVKDSNRKYDRLALYPESYYFVIEYPEKDFLRLATQLRTKETESPKSHNFHEDKEKKSALLYSKASTMTDPSTTKSESTKAAHHESDSDISNMALYNLSRTYSILASLSSKPKWTNADTSSFDCMHYNGDSAIDHCASKLGLQPGQHVLDIGSGFSATGRFLATNYGAHVTGIELQAENHELAQRITMRNVDPRVVERVRSVNADFLSLTPESLVVRSGDGGALSTQFDHVVSLMCIMHIPTSARKTLFEQAARFVKPRGKMYVEDLYDRSCKNGTVSHFTERELHQLQEIVACPQPPSASKYIADIEAAGFEDVEFEDVSERYTEFVCARAENYRASKNLNAALQIFYNTMAEVFEGGNLGGVRLTAVRR